MPYTKHINQMFSIFKKRCGKCPRNYKDIIIQVLDEKTCAAEFGKNYSTMDNVFNTLLTIVKLKYEIFMYNKKAKFLQKIWKTCLKAYKCNHCWSYLYVMYKSKHLHNDHIFLKLIKKIEKSRNR